MLAMMPVLHGGRAASFPRADGPTAKLDQDANVRVRPIAHIRRLLSGSTPMLRHRHGRDMKTITVPSPQDCDPYADRRVYPRVAVALPAFLQADGRRHVVQMLDLSAGGAKLICLASLSIGTAVDLDCGTFGQSGVVRWQEGQVLGLSFDTELDAREVAALIDRSNALTARMETRE